MKIIEKVKYNIGKKIVLHQIRKQKSEEQRIFNNFYNRVKTVIILLPFDENLLKPAIEVARFLQIHKKYVTFFTQDYKRNLLPNYENFHFISYQQKDVSFFYLAKNEIISKFVNQNFDLLINLDRTECLFYASIISKIKAEIKISLKNDDFEDLFNLIFQSKETNPENSFKNLLNSFQMF